uniref:Cationic amino acid transporter C-terminal domain-containing protein n=1 Tax=Anopheles farauti TaxID=69004 RepID=A0A182QJB0_9DIPT
MGCDTQRTFVHRVRSFRRPQSASNRTPAMASPSCWRILTRRKVLSYDGSSEKLGRILNTFDLTALGVGATLGVGVYVLAGHVSKDQAGPSVVLSFLIAAAASFLAGLCYAEFGARVPKSGSAYIYSYVCIGEFMAFIIGWNLMLEYIIGSASVSRGLSLYIDTLANDTMKTRFLEVAPIEWDFMSNYFDFFAFSVAILLGIALAFGLKKSTMVNNAFTVLNIFIVLFVIVAGAIKADPENWRIKPENVSSIYNVGEGGFFPFGFEGTLRGAATCFFGFVGFDCIATTGEEVRNPRKAIPRAILFSLCTIFLAYFGVSTVLTLMWPYYKQDVNAPLPFVFNEIGWHFAKWIVAIGGIIGLVASLFGAMFPQPRIIYAMAQDGLIFRALGEVSPRFKTPVFGTLCAALLTGTMGGLFDLKALVNMLSIGTLMAYTVVAISILILRFSENPDPSIPTTSTRDTYESSNLLKARERVTGSAFFKQLFNLSCIRLPTNVSSSVVGVLVTIYCLLAIALSLTIFYAQDAIYGMEPWAWILFGVLLGLTLLVLLLISIQPRERADAPFRVPLVPLLPGISIFVNIYLMLMLDVYTWIRFGIWMGIGLVIYFACVCFGKQSAKNPDVRVPPHFPPVETNVSEMGYRRNDNVPELENGSIMTASDRTVQMEYAPQQNGFYSQNLSTAMAVETADKSARLMELKAPTVPAKELAVVGTMVGGAEVAIAEPEEDQRQTRQPKSNTPTPKSSFDEIIPLSEGAVRGFTEKIEPNGKVYFVAQEENESERDNRRTAGDAATGAGELSEPASMTDEKETSKAIAFLDHILDDEDTLPSGEEPLSSGEYVAKFRTGDDESLASPVFREQSVIADIHRADESIVEIPEPVRAGSLEGGSNTDETTTASEAQGEEKEAAVESEQEARQTPAITIASEESPTDSGPEKLKVKPRVMYIAGMREDGEPSPRVLTEEEQDDINFRAAEKERFMTRLSTLLVNPVKAPLKRLQPPDESRTVGELEIQPKSVAVAPQPTSPGIIRSTSEPSFVLLLNKLNHTDSPQESETDEPEQDRAHSEHSSVVIPPAPKFDPTLFNTIRAGSVVPETPKSPIPMAPKFDPVLFNTLGKGKAQRASILPTPEETPQTPAPTPATPSAAQYFDVELKKLKPASPSPSIAPALPIVFKATSQTKDPPGRDDPVRTEDGSERPTNPREAFKSRLEKILLRGPMDAPGRPKSMQPVPLVAVSEENIHRSIADQQQPASSTDSGLSMASSTNSVASVAAGAEKPRDESFRDRARGFDTAKKKQKLLFDDVLKSINPETRPSSIRNSVEHRVSFRNFKEGLRKTVPPKQFLPDA